MVGHLLQSVWQVELVVEVGVGMGVCTGVGRGDRATTFTVKFTCLGLFESTVIREGLEETVAFEGSVFSSTYTSCNPSGA